MTENTDNNRLRKKKRDLYEKEALVLKDAKEILNTPDLEDGVYREKLSDICDQYEELLDQIVLVTKVSDRLQGKLNKTNEELEKTHRELEQNHKELQSAYDAVTQAKVQRKATTYTLIFFIFVVLISEWQLEPFMEGVILESHFFPDNLVPFAGLIFKVFLALTLRPVEGIVERRMLKRSQDGELKKHLA